MKRKTFVLSLLALILIVCMAIPGALAFFTDNDNANGSVPLTLGSEVEIREDIVGLKKTITIENQDGDPVWIRAIVYVGSTYAPYLKVTPGSGWSPAGGTGAAQNGKWFNYQTPVAKDEATTDFVAELTDVPDTGEFYVESFGMSVQYESIPVLYDEDGDPIPWWTEDGAEYYGDDPWAQPLDVATSSPGDEPIDDPGTGENP